MSPQTVGTGKADRRPRLPYSHFLRTSASSPI